MFGIGGCEGRKEFHIEFHADCLIWTICHPESCFSSVKTIRHTRTGKYGCRKAV